MEKLRFERKKKLTDKRAFYVTLTISMLAIGFITYSAFKAEDSMKKYRTESGSVSSMQNVGKNVSDVPYPESSAAAVSESEQPGSAESTPASSLISQQSEQPESAETSVTTDNGFVLPCGGKIIKYCDLKHLQYSETYKDWRLHTGVDIAVQKNGYITSAGNGTVSKIYYDELFGTVVEIDHGDKISGIYAGLNAKPAVKEGDKVTSNTNLGTAAGIPCESVEQSHLHFAVKINGQYVDPVEKLNLDKEQ